ncbi:MAG TPA: gamma-type small acid-soluble spore protein [Brevibacillus sp.]|nr:gamma-type small acid-soluble spore protein [Brevibacillus sp.]
MRNKQQDLNNAARAAAQQNTATEFASETNAVPNQASAARAAAQQNTATEFASETNVAQVQKQNRVSAARAAQQNNATK